VGLQGMSVWCEILIQTVKITFTTSYGRRCLVTMTGDAGASLQRLTRRSNISTRS
jgi:hypothetical protein